MESKFVGLKFNDGIIRGGIAIDTTRVEEMRFLRRLCRRLCVYRDSRLRLWVATLDGRVPVHN